MQGLGQRRSGCRLLGMVRDFVVRRGISYGWKGVGMERET